MKRFAAIVTMIALLCSGIAVFSLSSHALEANVSMWASKYTIDVNETVTISFAVQPAAPCHMEADLDGGGGSISAVNATSGNFDRNGTKILSNGAENGAYTGTITISFSSPGSKTVTLWNLMLARPLPDGTTDQTVKSASVTVYVRTEAERQAALAEEQRIREEQERQRQEEASRQAAANESRAIEASIEQSIRESIIEESYRQESIRESIKASESEVEATRPSEIGDHSYARQTVSDGSGSARVFYFVLSDENVTAPDGFYETRLTVNTKAVKALKTPDMSKDTYLVYGLFEGDDEPEYYYYNKTEGTFFKYAFLHKPVDPESESEESEEPSESTEPEELTSEEETQGANRFYDGENKKKLFAIAGFSFLIGAVIASIIAAIAGIRGRKKAAAEYDEDPEPFEEPEADEEPSENTVIRKQDAKKIRFEEMEDDFTDK